MEERERGGEGGGSVSLTTIWREGWAAADEGHVHCVFVWLCLRRREEESQERSSV